MNYKILFWLIMQICDQERKNLFLFFVPFLLLEWRSPAIRIWYLIIYFVFLYKSFCFFFIIFEKRIILIEIICQNAIHLITRYLFYWKFSCIFIKKCLSLDLHCPKVYRQVFDHVVSQEDSDERSLSEMFETLPSKSVS